MTIGQPAPPPKDLKNLLARQIAEVFRREGYEGASLAHIAKATGLQKGSLYHHFPNGKEDMAKAALQVLAHEADEKVSIALCSDKSPREKLKDWAEKLNQFYDHGKNNCILGAMVLSGGNQRLGDELKRAFERWINQIACVLTAAGIDAAHAEQRAKIAIERIQGALILARALNEPDNFQHLVKALPDMLLGDTEFHDH